MKSIIIEINNDGEVVIETLGFKGEACAKATEAIEKALGVPSSRKKKPEYTASTTAHQKVGGA
jgi:hypothetical protein